MLIIERCEFDARTSSPVDVPLASWPPVASNRHRSIDKFWARATLMPAPPDTKAVATELLGKAAEMLQLVKVEPMTETEVAR